MIYDTSDDKRELDSRIKSCLIVFVHCWCYLYMTLTRMLHPILNVTSWHLPFSKKFQSTLAATTITAQRPFIRWKPINQVRLVLWHINHCRLFNAKFSLYIYIKYTWFACVGVYGISTIVAYLMPNPLYTYILNIYDLVWFYAISTFVGYLTPNLVLIDILNIYMICKHIL